MRLNGKTVSESEGGNNMKNICVFCGGDMKKKKVTVVKERKGNVVVIENVPASVCAQCGEKEYEFKVAKHIEKVLAHRTVIKKKMEVPVADFQAAR